MDPLLPLPDFDAVLESDDNGVGNGDEQAALYDAWEQLDLPRQRWRVFDRIEPAVQNIVAVIGHEWSVAIRSELSIAAQILQQSNGARPGKREDFNGERPG